jgi:hypothetical protein
MCLLTFFPPDVQPDTDALLNGAVLNDDGHGFAIATPGTLIIERGLGALELIGAFEAARHRHRSGSALFHSRYGTHGNQDLGNCHPFPVGGDTRTVLAHNGVLPRIVWPAKDDHRSDTRITAEDFLPVFGSLRTRRTRTRLERWMTPANKMVILTVDRRFKQQSFILNEDAGIWDGGIWYSNDGYLPPPVHALREPGSPLWDDDTLWDSRWEEIRAERCEYCGTLIGPYDDACHRCGWCLDCGQMPQSCDCYTPAALAQQRGRASGQ